jgi:hypothetical protein
MPRLQSGNLDTRNDFGLPVCSPHAYPAGHDALSSQHLQRMRISCYAGDDLLAASCKP